jgi:hypothetical protein
MLQVGRCGSAERHWSSSDRKKWNVTLGYPARSMIALKSRTRSFRFLKINHEKVKIGSID